MPPESLRLFFSEPPANGLRPAIFFDRDGVINVREPGGYVTEWTRFRFVPGVRQAMKELAAIPLPIIVVSNQACVGKGLIAPADLAALTRRFVQALERSGARVDAVYYCTHTSEQSCGCRKPKHGLLVEAARDWQIDLDRSVLIGDSKSDLEAARAAGCRAIWLAPCGPIAPDVLAARRPADIVPIVRRLLA